MTLFVHDPEHVLVEILACMQLGLICSIMPFFCNLSQSDYCIKLVPLYSNLQHVYLKLSFLEGMHNIIIIYIIV